MTDIAQKKNEVYVCQACGKCFTELRYMLLHFKSHSQAESDVSENQSQSKLSNSSPLSRSHNSKKHKRRHEFPANMEVLKEECHGNDRQPPKCKNCGKSYKRHKNLANRTAVRGRLKAFSCKLCGKCYRFSTGLQRHMAIHSGENPYVCKKCGKGYLYYEALVAHERTHVGEKPYVCKNCGKSFSTIYNCRTHVAGHYMKK